MPTRHTKKGEIQQLQYEVGNEIVRDAPHIAQGVFGNNAIHPDMASISNAEVDQLFRDAYARNDRDFLMSEAQRDPQQFLDVTDRIGVPDPPTDMHGEPAGPDPQALQKAFQNAAQVAPPPGGMVPVPPQAPMPAALPAPAVPAAAAALPGQLPLPGMPPQPLV